MATGPLLASFVSALPADSGLRDQDLEAALRERWAAGGRAWPTVRLEPDAFMRYLAERSSGTELPALERAADLFLACACLHGSAGAVEAFDATYRGEIARAVARMAASPAFADDVVQAVCERLFTGTPGEPARIAQYEGRASLRGWLSTMAKRTALNVLRKSDEKAHASVSAVGDTPDAALGADVMLLKARYKGAFEGAIRAAMASLPARERTLLLLHFVDGLTLPQLAAMNKVSRATVTRWLGSARDALRDETRRQLEGRLRLTSSELASVAAAVRSQLEISIAGAMRGEGRTDEHDEG